MTAVAGDDEILRRSFVAIATAAYDDPAFPPLTVDGEVDALKGWLCAPELRERRFSHVYPHLARDPASPEIREALRQRPGAVPWSDADAAVVFVTGHGVLADGRHWTVLKGTSSGQWWATALPTVEIVGTLRDSGIRHLLLVLDLCFAGDTIADVARFTSDLPPTWLVLPSATKGQEAVTGALAGAVTAFLHDLTTDVGGRWGGSAVPYLDVSEFITGVQERLGDGQRLIPLHGSKLSGPHPCLPNPHYSSADAAPVARRRSDLALPRKDLESHWEPRSRGLADTRESGWLFTGRQRLMRDLIAAATGDAGATLVTGVAGSGKSGVLARLVTLSDPELRARFTDVVAAVPEDLRPGEGVVDVAVLATGKTAYEVIAQICAAFDIPPPTTAGAMPSLDEWLAAWQGRLAGQAVPVTVVVDALDEAADPSGLLTKVLTRLDPDGDRVRLVIGVRSPGGDRTDVPDGWGIPLADQSERQLGARRLRVDEAPWWQPSDLVGYAHALLTRDPASPYNRPGTPPGAAEDVARALAARAGTSFLVTRLAATSLAQRPYAVDAADAAWLATIDQGVRGVFGDDLRGHLPDPEDRIRAVHLLRAVAFARGRGLPWRRLWPALANAVADDPERTYGDGDIAWLLHSRLAGYLTTDIADGVTVYRLFHDALRGTLREGWRQLL